ncbi:uncharacterized protein LOC112090531 [Morus notabilis]|uniref:uncharacterized protein LOC112090531 n=1 Tax=Morus notabilis TaxID=981085 RepID=UPI000CECEA9D|nr:uncharacterized protein LOC112090531 [Morus notabilis]
MSKFLVVKGCDQYNVVIGRSTLRALKAATSIYHQTMKFLTPTRIGRVHGNQYESRLTYSETVRHYAEPTQVRRELRMVETRAEGFDLDPRLPTEEPGTRPVEELTEVPIDEREPLRRLKVGSGPEGLNIDEKCPPERQKRRPMNAERYEALRAEVDKLIRNNFIREVLYPEWVSNPVLVQKPNGDWRTCVDFSDLACPKDSFPLPRID